MIFKIKSILSALLIVLLSACVEDKLLSDGDIPVGEGNIHATISFIPVDVADIGHSRTSGDAIKRIYDFCVLIYNEDGTLYRKITSTELGIKDSDYKNNTAMPDPNDALEGNGAHQAETTTPQVGFTLPKIAFGKYYMYAVANMGDMSGYNVSTVDDLRKITVNWDPEHVEDNNQMFGYFTLASEQKSAGFQSDLIVVKPGVELHSWIKRCASKVTIAYDPSGLNQDVFIYVKKVTLHDLPRTCLLAAENKPSAQSQLYNPANTTSPELNTVITYPDDGKLDMAFTDPNCTGMELVNGYKTKGSNHSETAEALFFYENNQGDFTGQSQYNKVQQGSGKPDGVGHNVREPLDKDGNKIPDSDREQIPDNDYKDRVRYGTYIEVEAYYVSRNPDNVAEGPIKYRFMLGKDINYNYDAQRNYHFKLTLGFKGWANQPDWHIDFDEPDPGMEVPPVFHMPYLYNQKADLPIKLLGNCISLNMTITENNWAPYDEKTKSVPANPTTAFEPGDYQFRWAKDVYEGGFNGVQRPYLGFLALQVPETDIPTDIITNYSFYTNNDGETPQEALRSYYISNHQNVRSFSSADNDFQFGEHPAGNNTWNVNHVLDTEDKPINNQRTLLVPMWTRNKTMILESGFSGNNPYEYFSRKAVVHIDAVFRENGVDVPKTADVTVLQVPRIVNPKGVWRSDDDNTGNFNVVLKQAAGSDAQSDYEDLYSEGSWSAYVEVPESDACVKVVKSATTDGELDEETGVLHGNTGSIVDFDLEFGEASATESKFAIVTVKYHGNNCIHKIAVRQGYRGAVTIGGNKWSSFSVYRARLASGTQGSSNAVFEADLTSNPLSLGSFFRRGRQTYAILTSNSTTNPTRFGAMKAPSTYDFTDVQQGIPDGYSKRTDLEWGDLDPIPNNRDTQASKDYVFGTYKSGTTTYRVPTLADFRAMNSEAEFAFGIIYGNGATETASSFADATGYQDIDNSGAPSTLGVRGVIAYNPTTGAQLLFPIGKDGMGRRRMFNFPDNNTWRPYRGSLWYSDVYNVLSVANYAGNRYRPIVYNLPIVSGAIYWINQYVTNGHSTGNGSLGWDINYFSLDFSPYTANNYQDGCPIKLIVTN